jgi:hypothetical protein
MKISMAESIQQETPERESDRDLELLNCSGVTCFLPKDYL